MHDTIIVGGGHNGLVAAFYLARAGRKPLVLERRATVGGCATSEEFAPGYRAATLAHTLGPLRPSIVRDMQLERHGVRFVHPDPRLVSVGADGRPLVFSIEPGKTADAIRPFSSKDAAKYPEFCATLARMGTFIGGLFDMTPPSIDAPTGGDVWKLLKTGRRFRGLPRHDAFSLLRWGPMAVADLVAEWFETDLLQAAIAARAIHGAAMGPWSAGTGAGLLLAAAVDPLPGGSSTTAVGGPGAVTASDGRGRAQGGRRDPHRRGGRPHLDQGRRGRGRGPGRRHRDPRDDRRLGRRSAADIPGPDRSGGARAGLHHADTQLSVSRDGREGQRGAAARSRRSAACPAKRPLSTGAC